MTRLAELSRVTHAMKREGNRGGSSFSSCGTAGVVVPETEGDGSDELREFKELRMPERIAIPRVPTNQSIKF